MKLDLRSIVFNGAAAMMFLGLIAYLIRSLFVTETILPCSQRFDHPTEFVLERGGKSMSPVQLQGVIGASGRNILENAEVVRVKGIASPRALKVSVTPDPMDQRETAPGNGLGFIWSPRAMDGAKSACLAYSVYFPKSLEFGRGGFLPGVYGGEPMELNAVSDGKTAFAQRIVWRNNGRGNLYAQMPGYDATGGIFLSTKGFDFPKGEWIELEQEIVLNTPGKKDGLARVFVNGELALEKKWLEWRQSGKLLLTGVQAEVGYGVPRRSLSPPKKSAIYLSPLQLRWN